MEALLKNIRRIKRKLCGEKTALNVGSSILGWEVSTPLTHVHICK